MGVVTLDATIGGTASNTYSTLAQAQTYHLAHSHGDDWEAAQDPARNRALAHATALIDQHFTFTGGVADTGQRLSWPRVGMVDRNQVTITRDELPRDLIDATAELARGLLQSDRTADSAAETEGIEMLKAGPVELRFKGNVGPKPIPDAVWYLLEQWGSEISRQAIAVPLVRA